MEMNGNRTGSRTNGSVERPIPIGNEFLADPNQLDANPLQACKRADPKKLKDLMGYIERDGQHDPVMVFNGRNGRYTIIRGHRRTAACRALGIPVRCQLYEGDPQLAFFAEHHGRRNTSTNELLESVCRAESMDSAIEQLPRQHRVKLQKMREYFTIPQIRAIASWEGSPSHLQYAEDFPSILIGFGFKEVPTSRQCVHWVYCQDKTQHNERMRLLRYHIKDIAKNGKVQQKRVRKDLIRLMTDIRSKSRP